MTNKRAGNGEGKGDGNGAAQIGRGTRFRLGFEGAKEDVAMNLTGDSGGWFDRWFPLLLIVFGLIFVTVLATFSPMT